MRTEKEIRELLENDPLYKAALEAAEPNDHARIRSSVEPMFIETMMMLEKFAELLSQDPEAQAELQRALAGKALTSDSPIVTDEPATSGSLR